MKYPYARYAQTFVADFIFGGMENISATTLTDTSLLDKRASLDADADGLLAHELAHQWFGDLLTCRDWSHGWLNEGFATYFEALFTEHNKGIDEFRYELYQNAQIYMGEDAGRYRRPIVNNVYHEPIDLFDRHLYEKGSLVLHMIRTVLGDELWWKAIRHYVEKHRSTNVTTPDLQRAIEIGDRPQHRLAVRRVRLPRRPSGVQARVRVGRRREAGEAQRHADAGREGLVGLPPAGRRRLHGRRQDARVQGADRREGAQLLLRAARRSRRWCASTPATTSSRRVEFKRGKDMLLYQLKNDDDVVGRIDAAKELAKLGDAGSGRRAEGRGAEGHVLGRAGEAARALGHDAQRERARRAARLR